MSKRPKLDPLKEIADAMKLSAEEWGDNRARSWIWGIVIGWDEKGIDRGNEMERQAKLHHWNDHNVAQLRALHEAFEKLIPTAPELKQEVH